MTSFGRQYDFHYVIYNILTRNVDNRRRNDFYNYWTFKCAFQSKQELQEILTVCSRGQNLKVSSYFNHSVGKNRNKLALAVNYCLLYHCLSVSCFTLMIYSL